jgi:AraC-like DNA-binding protein
MKLISIHKKNPVHDAGEKTAGSAGRAEVDSLEDPRPWHVARRGWRVENLSGEEAASDFVVSVVEAELESPMLYHGASGSDGLLLRVALDGGGELLTGGVAQKVLSGAVTAIGLTAAQEVKCRFASGRHRFVSFRFSSPYLNTLLTSGEDALREGLTKVLAGRRLEGERPFALSEPLASIDRGIAESVAKPPLAGVASQLWFRAKAIEFLSGWCYREPEATRGGGFFCSLQKRTVMERVEKAKAYLASHLDEPLELAALARVAGCSPSYLSRQFSAETGLTLSRYLRGLRVAKAADFLASGRMNISEAALEVGYQSLSHFARAFQEERGMTPSEFIGAF